jgi:hypothetical protein
MLQLHNGPFRNAAMQHLHECRRWGLHPFSLGHFLGFMDAVVSFLVILIVARRRPLTHHIKLRETGEHYQNTKGESVCLFFQLRRQLLQMVCLFVWLLTPSAQGSRRLLEMTLRTRLTPFRGLSGTHHRRFGGVLRVIAFGMQAFEMGILLP